MTATGERMYWCSRTAHPSRASPAGVPPQLEPRFEFRKPVWPDEIEPLLERTRVVVSKAYANPWQNRLILEARRRGIRSLFVVDGPLEWSNSYRNPSLCARIPGLRGLMEPLVYDCVAATSPEQARYLAFKNSSRRIEFMSYRSHRIDSTRDRAGEAETAPEWDFLITTAKRPYFDDTERAELVRVLERTCAALDAAGHRYAVRLFERDLLSGRPEIENLVDGTFAEALGRVRGVIGTSSSVLLESMLHRKPTALLMYRDSPLFYQTGWLLGCTSDFAETFASMLAAEPERMDFQASVLDQHVGREDFYPWFEAWLDRDVGAEATLDRSSLEFENAVLRGLFGGVLRAVDPLMPLLRWWASGPVLPRLAARISAHR